MTNPYISHRHSPAFLKVGESLNEKAKQVFEHHFATADGPHSTEDFFGNLWCEAISSGKMPVIRKTVTVRCWYIDTTPNFENRSRRPDIVFEMDSIAEQPPMVHILWVNEEARKRNTKLKSAVVHSKMKST